MSWNLEQAANDLERYVLRGELPAIDACKVLIDNARIEQTCHKNPPDALVVYKGDEVIGTFDSYEQAAEFLGVKVSSVKFMASPTYQRRKGSKRPTGRICVERIYFEEGEEW